MVLTNKKHHFMKSSIIKTLALAIASIGLLQAQKVTFTKKWQTDTTLKTPESVIYDPASKALYASIINGKAWEKDGNGSIAKISLSGKIENAEWVKGLDAPKGMGIYQNKLYVADIAKVVVIDIKSGKIEKSIEVAGAININDLTIDNKGNVYVSDCTGKKIFQIKSNEVSIWLADTSWKYPNGVLALENSFKFIDMRGGNLYDVSYTDKSTRIIAQNVPWGDGIVEIGKDEYLISNWNGEINYVSGNTIEKVLDTKDAKINAADIWYIPSEKLVLVPTFFGNTIAAYFLEKK